MSIRVLAVVAMSLILAACASPGGYSSRGYGGSDGYARCYDCGTVERVERVYGEGRASGGGAVLGGIVGGVLGSQVGSGSGRDAATVAGAIAGGVAGHNVEQNRNAASQYELFVRMDDGRRIVVRQRDLDGIREGAYVRVNGNRARLL
jgi:outer membrane lipoprotein SlyB